VRKPAAESAQAPPAFRPPAPTTVSHFPQGAIGTRATSDPEVSRRVFRRLRPSSLDTRQSVHWPLATVSFLRPKAKCEDEGVSGFVERFRLAIASSQRDAVRREEVVLPAWFGQPEDELGIVVSQALEVGRSTTGVVGLRYVTAFSTGLLLELAAAARGLKESRAQALFHEQHLADPDEGLPDGFLRVGIEYPDGRQASNLAGKHPFLQMEAEPEPGRALADRRRRHRRRRYATARLPAIVR
jgi:hypothetical protein